MSDEEVQSAEEIVPNSGAGGNAPETHAMGPMVARSAVGGILMGLANLVPGISGGTMLLASGVYLEFIGAIAKLSRLKFEKRSIVVLGVIVLFALLAIVLGAGPVKDLVVGSRWIMYSLFIGLTLGGVPIVWKLAKPATGATWVGVAIGFGTLAALALSSVGGGSSDGFLLMFIAGLAGASAMILPGVSGGYLLVLMGAYVPLLAGIDAFKEALKAADVSALMAPFTAVVLPVGLGVVVGVLVVSNGLKWVLERYEKLTLGVLLGFLFGSVVGLWPFQHGVEPSVGDRDVRGRLLTEELLAELSPEKWPVEYFTPTGGQIGMSLGLIVVGFLITMGVAKLGAAKDELKAQAGQSTEPSAE